MDLPYPNYILYFIRHLDLDDYAPSIFTRINQPLKHVLYPLGAIQIVYALKKNFLYVHGSENQIVIYEK